MRFFQHGDAQLQNQLLCTNMTQMHIYKKKTKFLNYLKVLPSPLYSRLMLGRVIPSITQLEVF